jgi:NADH dehydrogenase
VLFRRLFRDRAAPSPPALDRLRPGVFVRLTGARTGGGPPRVSPGVEIEVLARHYPSIPPGTVRLVLVGNAVLPQTATNLAAYTRQQLVARSIELETARAARVTEDGLVLQDGRLIPSACVIWTAGTRVSPIVADLPLPRARDGRLLVNEFFEVDGAPGVYALGDNAAQQDPHTQQPYVATAQVAVRQAAALARVIEARLTGRAKRPFRFRVLGEMVPLSRRTAVADLSGLKLVGFPAWFLWKTIHMLKLPALPARLRVVLDCSSSASPHGWRRCPCSK